jgi:hypothetical protein
MSTVRVTGLGLQCRRVLEHLYLSRESDISGILTGLAAASHCWRMTQQSHQGGVDGEPDPE